MTAGLSPEMSVGRGPGSGEVVATMERGTLIRCRPKEE